ncbi:MAG: Uma2 family endonuclease [Desulfococcaceae bacterium]|jgi:Uma2 family endonuclease|nr:Uma2 family endonuclease [Desulfococcaceae bacterium]
MPRPSLKPDILYTYNDYLSWNDEFRRELIEGVPFCMSPAPNTQHQRVSGGLFYLIYAFLNERNCEVFSAPFDVRLMGKDKNEDECETVVQPDISVICDPGKIDEQGCKGAPDWIIEVLSPATASKDHIKKRELYEKHGVKEYWLADPANRIVHIYRADEEGKYTAPRIFSAEEKIRSFVLPDLHVDLKSVFREKRKQNKGKKKCRR